MLGKLFSKKSGQARDTAYNTPRQDLVPRDHKGIMLVGDELDADIERAMTAYPGWAEVEQ